MIVKAVPLSAPVTAGELLTTLILYPVPVEVPLGIVTEIDCGLDAVDTTLCSVTGELHPPLASDNCAVNVQEPPLRKFPAGE